MTTSYQIPGEPTKSGTSILETAEVTIQSFAPVNRIHQHLCAVHFYGDDMTRQVEAHHFCAHQNDEVRQCLIYSGPDADSLLIGIEYVVSENLFLTLPDAEKPLWHPHEYEVKSGVLFLPGVAAAIQRPELAKVAKTYGKVFHFWQLDRGDTLPLGLPQVMMALTKDGQIYDHLAHGLEEKFGVSFEKEKENRAYMLGPENGVHPLASGGGKGMKIVLRETTLAGVHSTA